MPVATLALTLGLSLLNGRAIEAVKTVSFTEADEKIAIEWWSPVAGMLRVYDINKDLFPEASRVALRHRHVSFLSLNNSVAVTAATDIVGAGVGKSQQVTFAGAATAATKVAAVAATSNALVANAQVQATEAAKATQAVKVIADGKTPLVAQGWFAWLRVTMSIGFVIKGLCMILNIFYQASPLPLIAEYKSKGDTGDADLAPFIFLTYGGWQWCFYGTFAYLVTNKTGFLVLVYSNCCGAAMGIYYVISFNANCHNPQMIARRSKYYCVLVAVMTSQFIAIESMPAVKALFFCGLISSAWSTVSAASLISTVPKVIESQNSKALPLPLLVMGWISSVLWVTCGFMLWDPWITFPNVFSLGVCTFALCLCFMYPPFEDSESPKLRESPYVCDQECLDVERTSPLQRVLSVMGVGSNSSEDQLLKEHADEKQYGSGGTGDSCGTGGTGDSC